mmetsp:Transcript_3999/g.7019  ORF Transcript_3999/g.7019 Transcript_3999/m.7019 type:complete len:754 (+) Transcript_3999:97-2358(+)|eukprot:CAMPEP_0184551548 /NCGR_PEP_ID=MMETSP0199_2-20130426/25479_1 /TAXON_ID=1112570 /ORGANISM="Thraustochytrium sp., Strain LLF1b" /LENGTH=753 /DNA_ID=CAMNT_0026946761 /DNA_START=82 /DNA_END=2343 /DNA_ORIENTATION=-
MEAEFELYFKRLKSAKKNPDKQVDVLRNLTRIAESTEDIDVKPAAFKSLTSLALKTKSITVRDASIECQVELFKNCRDPDSYASKELIRMCTTHIFDANVTMPCLTMLVVTLSNCNEKMVEYAVQMGVVNMFFRLMHVTNLAAPTLLRPVRDLCLTGLNTLAENEKYAVLLHEKDIWTTLVGLFDQGYLSLTSLTIIKFIVSNIQKSAAVTSASSEVDEEDDLVLFTRRRISRRMNGGSGLELLDDANLSNNQRNSTSLPRSSRRRSVAQEAYTEDDGLLITDSLDESKLDLPSRVSLDIDRKGVMGMLLSVCQTQGHDELADASLAILGLLAPNLHKVIAKENRIIIVRVLLNLVDGRADGRLISVAYVLDSFLRQRSNRGIVLQCGAAIRCAKTGNKLLQRKDQVSRTICQCMSQLLLSIAQIPDGPPELSNPECIGFLAKSMQNIAKTELPLGSTTNSLESTGPRRSRKNDWSKNVEVVSLVTLIIVAIESPVMSNVAEANLHKALVAASKRGDELGLLAVLGSTFFVGQAKARARSREIPKVHPALVDMLSTLLNKSLFDQPALGGIEWTTYELLQAVKYLVQGPHNLNHLRKLLPSMIETLKVSVANDRANEAGISVEILLFMSYNKYIMTQMAETPDLLKVLGESVECVTWDVRRSASTLIQSIEIESTIEKTRKKAQRLSLSSISQAGHSSSSLIKSKVGSITGRSFSRLSMKSKGFPSFPGVNMGSRTTSSFVVSEDRLDEEETT